VTGLHLDLMSSRGADLHRLSGPAFDALSASGISRVGFMAAAKPDPVEGLDLAREVFAGRAEVVPLDLVAGTRPSLEAALDGIGLLYIPGGNTYTLMARLRQSGMLAPVRARLLAGLPLVGVSAGALVCGADTSDSTDPDFTAASDTAGIGLLPWSIVVHYPSGATVRAQRDERIRGTAAPRPLPVLALGEDALLSVRGSAARVIEGSVWMVGPHGRERFRGADIG
jgi:peptidase E